MPPKGRKITNKKYYKKNRELILMKRKLKYLHTINLDSTLFQTENHAGQELQEIQGMQEYCRLCAVLRNPEEIKCNIDDVQQKLVTCCNWHLYRDHHSLPRNVCISCFLQLEQCCFFHESVSRAQQKLSELAGLDVEDNDVDVQVKLEAADEEFDIGTVMVSELKVENDIDIGNDNYDNNYENYDCDEPNIDGDSLEENASINVQKEKTNSETKKTKCKNPQKKSKSIKKKYTNRMIKFDIKSLLSHQDVNEDGTVKSEKMEQLNLYSWEAVTHRCHICREDFNTQSELCAHFTSIHSNKRFKYVCTICPDETQFVSGRYYREHVTKYHHPHLTYCCHRCQKFFYENHKLRKHIKSHPRETKISVCTTCGKEFSYYKNLHFHMLTHLPVELQPKFECFLCKKQLKSHQSVRAHMKYHTGIIKTNICDQCGKAFVTAYKLKKHMSMHSDERPFTCETCQKTFKTSAILRRHARSHQDFKPFVCEVCGHRTSNKAGLKMHIVRYHTDEPPSPFPCSICGKTFSSAQTMKTHQKYVHFGDRPFTCNICDFRAAKPSILKQHHKHVHLDHRPHACKLCDYRTYKKHNLRLHTSRRHPNSIDQSSPVD